MEHAAITALRHALEAPRAGKVDLVEGVAVRTELHDVVEKGLVCQGWLLGMDVQKTKAEVAHISIKDHFKMEFEFFRRFVLLQTIPDSAFIEGSTSIP